MTAQHVIHISSLPPTLCGVAEYTEALVKGLHECGSELSPFFIRLHLEAREKQKFGQGVTINPAERDAMEWAAAAANHIEPRVALLQHEFKLYGGEDGDNLLWLLRSLKCRVITTLHTVSPVFPPNRQRIFIEMLRLSSHLIVFSTITAELLCRNFGVSTEKISVIPHGIPDVPFVEPPRVELSDLLPKRVRFLTAGLLRPAKGIEHALTAMFQLRKSFPHFEYVICGADHPRNPGAKEYRRKLENLVAKYGLQNEVHFVNRFLEPPELIDAIQACDVGVLPYTSSEQCSSGVLALMLGCGRPVVATAFQHAKAVLENGGGILVSSDLSAMASAIELLARDDGRRKSMAESSYKLTRSWIWSEVAQRHCMLLRG